ncbi:hypothetical protein J4443_01505 [Candidatus Woesearchaeota archaeon]|nr:hypothetical protein [Candidatus Woesearchaeota archaeon]
MDPSKIVKTVLLVTIAVLFLITSVMSVVSASRGISEATKNYVLKVETCEYKPLPPLRADEETSKIPEQECKVDYNRTKGILADSIAMLIISLPIAVFTYKKLFKVYRE